MRLVLENKDGKAVRTFHVNHDSAVVISRRDTRRVEVHASLDQLDKDKVKYDRLGDVRKSEIAAAPLSMPGGAHLKLVETVGDVVKNEVPSKESSKSWYTSLVMMAVLMIAMLLFVMNRPMETAKLEQELKKEIVMIVKNIPKPKREEQKVAQKMDEPEVKQPTKKAVSIKRLGALSVLGSLNNSKQRGGVNLGAVNTTAGPGLGGTQGSGGVQTTLYGKGLVAAPLGAGANMQGAGGYGTKGKGGGQAGYGKLSLVGSAGTAPIPLGREAIIDGGLDRDLIADVVNRNMGQVRFCYEQGLQGDPSLAGRVAISWTIDSNGQVKTASVASTTLNSKLVEDCIVMRLRSWKFPLPEGGMDVKVSFPFVLKRAGQG